ncbi:unnamed protein product [Mucor hiemalis]
MFDYTRSPSLSSPITSPESITNRFSDHSSAKGNLTFDGQYSHNVVKKPEVTSPTRQRARDHTMESVGTVKIAPAGGKFDDIKSEAATFWDEGFDLKLDTKAKAKKKAEWLSQEDFFLNDSSPTPGTKSKRVDANQFSNWDQGAQEQWLPSSSTISSGSGYNKDKRASWQQDHQNVSSSVTSNYYDKNDTKSNIAPAWHQQTQEWSSPPSSSNVRPDRTYAEAADRNTPAWASSDANKPTQLGLNPFYFQQQQRPQQPWIPSSHVVMMPSPYMSIPPAMFPNQSKFDNDLILLLRDILRGRRDATMAKLQKKFSTILHRLQELSPRTFSMLLDVTVLILDEEAARKQMDTVRRIRESWPYFSFFFVRHVHIFARLPEDLLTLLSFATRLQSYAPKLLKDMPIADILKLYENVKESCSSEERKECIRRLRLMNVLPDEEEADWRDLDSNIPPIPSSESIVAEVGNNLNILIDYEAKKEVSIVNKVQNPWPKVDLLNYTLVQYMLLREEFSRPIQNTIKNLFSENLLGDTDMQIGCATYKGAIPRGITMIVSSSDPIVVFNLGPPALGEEIMGSFEEGSLVLLLPELSTNVTPVDWHSYMMNIAKGATMGIAIRAASSKGNKGFHRMVSIHFNKQELHKIDWSSRYTIITCHKNAASTLSVLHWLHKQHFELKKDSFSSVLTPRILAANNILSPSQITAWDEENTENALAVNQDAIPDYLANVEIDISCVMAARGNFKARPGEERWPRHSSQWENVAISKRPPLYNLSPSQIAAVQYAMCHRIAVITGVSGTGKTHIATKLAQLMTEALNVGQFHQPVLIITKSLSTLDAILNGIVRHIPDVVRFGGQTWDDALLGKQATRLATFDPSDANFRQHQGLERQLSKNQTKLNALMLARFQASHHDPELLSSTIAPMYFRYLQEGYSSSNNASFAPNQLSIWNSWASQDDKTMGYPIALEILKEKDYTQWTLESDYLKRAGRGTMPIMDPNLIQSRFNWVANNVMNICRISDCVNWPFESSIRTGNNLRASLLEVWERVPAEKIWSLSMNERTKIIESLARVLIQYIDHDIQDVLQDQAKTAKAFDESLLQKWSYLCRFNRVIGITSDDAAANRDWLSTLWPRAVIVDEASEILESFLTSVILGPRTEHVVLLGDNDMKSKPRLSNPELCGNPRNLDTSLFVRLKRSGSKFMLLEEQWRMLSPVADVIDKFNSIRNDDSSLLVTAPMASCNENMVDGSSAQNEKLYGITQRAFYVDYQAEKNTRDSDKYSRYFRTDLSEAEVDEARFVAFFAVYLSQQAYPVPQITILATCLRQKYLIRLIIRDEVPKRTCFTNNVSKINLDTIEQYSGRQDGFTIISTATPGSSCSPYDNVNRAITRSKYGVFVIGKPGIDNVHPRWVAFAEYMKERKLFGTHLQLTCHAHGDMFSVGRWQDFDAMKNGGCSTPCGHLMSDGHVCKETCHFLSHDAVVCHEPCNRLRPSVCTHACTNMCFECSKNGACPPCEENVTLTLSCGHVVSGVCHTVQTLNSKKCQAPVTAQMPCEHEIVTMCHKAQDISKLRCEVKIEVTLECGHVAVAKCGSEPMCTEMCSGVYECGHSCQNMCGMPHSHERAQCPASCSKQLICGHGCDNGCANPDKHTERCMMKCNYACSHGYKCSRECWKDCIRCVSECPYKCNHQRCTKKCFEICDRPPCNESCKLNLKCSHPCLGLCGEPCPPCSICNGDLECSISLRKLSEFEPDEKVYVLPECGCGRMIMKNPH